MSNDYPMQPSQQPSEPTPPMPYQQPQYPQYSQPTAPQPQRKSRTGWIIAGIVGGVLIVCCAGTLIVAAIGGNNKGFAGSSIPTQTATAPLIGTQVHVVVPTATVAPTHAAVPTATHTTAKPTPTVAAGGPPEIGAPLSDFEAAYGAPISQGGNPYNFNANKAQTVIVSVTITKGAASSISVLGPTSWSKSETFNACALYLPPDATQFNSAPPYTDFHSNLGEIVIANYGEGTCQVYTAG